MTKRQLPLGETFKVKVFVRKYEDGCQVFGAIVEGADLFDMPEGDTVLVAADLIISNGVKVVDKEQYRSGNSMYAFMEKI